MHQFAVFLLGKPGSVVAGHLVAGQVEGEELISGQNRFEDRLLQLLDGVMT